MTENVKKNYAKELEDNIIEKVETLLNQVGVDRGNRIRSQNPTHKVIKSVCVSLTPHPGKPLAEMTLKLDIKNVSTYLFVCLFQYLYDI